MAKSKGTAGRTERTRGKYPASWFARPIGSVERHEAWMISPDGDVLDIASMAPPRPQYGESVHKDAIYELMQYEHWPESEEFYIHQALRRGWSTARFWAFGGGRTFTIRLPGGMGGSLRKVQSIIDKLGDLGTDPYKRRINVVFDFSIEADTYKDWTGSVTDLMSATSWNELGDVESHG